MPAITLYTTPFCPYCVSAKRLLEQRGYAFTDFDVSRDYGLRQRISRENGGYSTVPMIFVGDRFVGGYTELAAMDRSGALGREMTAAQE